MVTDVVAWECRDFVDKLVAFHTKGLQPWQVSLYASRTFREAWEMVHKAVLAHRT